MSSDITCKILSSIPEIKEIYDEWDTLHKKLGYPLFIGPDWFFLWWDTLAQEQDWKPFIVTARKDDSLVGVLALAEKNYLGFRILEWAGSEAFDYCEILAESPFVIQSLYNHLKSNLENRVLCLRDLRKHSPSFPILESFAHKARTRKAYAVKLDEKRWQGWLQSRSKNFRRNIKRNSEKFEKKGNTNIKIFEEMPVPNDIIGFLFENKKEWCLRKGMNSIVLYEKALDYFHGLVSLTAKKRQLFLLVTFCDRKPIVCEFCFIHEGVVFSYLSSYDKIWYFAAPGIIGFFECIKAISDRNLNELDFMRGDEKYKKDFANEEFDLVSFVFGKSIVANLYTKLLCVIWPRYDELRHNKNLRTMLSWYRSIRARLSMYRLTVGKNS